MRPRPEPGGPGGKYLGRTGPMPVPELREALTEIRAQLDREADVLAELAEVILADDLEATAALLTHLRDLFAVISALLHAVDVAEERGA